MSPKRITLSTSGIVPKMYELGRADVRPKLAVSLNASTEEGRQRLMPITRKYHLRDLIKACRDYPLRSWEKLTFEYVLLTRRERYRCRCPPRRQAARQSELQGQLDRPESRTRHSVRITRPGTRCQLPADCAALHPMLHPQAAGPRYLCRLRTTETYLRRSGSPRVRAIPWRLPPLSLPSGALGVCASPKCG